MGRLICYLPIYLQFHLQAIADHFSAGIFSPGIAPINPNVCKIQINTTTNTTMLSKLLIAPAIGMYVLISHITKPTTTRITTILTRVTPDTPWALWGLSRRYLCELLRCACQANKSIGPRHALVTRITKPDECN